MEDLYMKFKVTGAHKHIQHKSAEYVEKIKRPNYSIIKISNTSGQYDGADYKWDGFWELVDHLSTGRFQHVIVYIDHKDESTNVLTIK